MINDTGFSQFVPPQCIAKSAGTWTPTVTSDVPSDVRTAAGASFTLIVPVQIPSNSAYRKGCRVKSVDIYWKNATANLTGFTVVPEKITLSASAITAPTGAALAAADFTINAEADTPAERYTQASFKMTITFTEPMWIDDDVFYSIVMVITAAAGSVFTLYGARINYDLRA
jgi:hypothetical protein